MTTTRTPISSNHWSTDSQAVDAMTWLHTNHRDVWDGLIDEFDDYETLIERQRELDSEWAWLDTDALGVDPDYMSWLVDAIEATGLVIWEDGEPWAEAVS